MINNIIKQYKVFCWECSRYIIYECEYNDLPEFCPYCLRMYTNNTRFIELATGTLIKQLKV